MDEYQDLDDDDKFVYVYDPYAMENVPLTEEEWAWMQSLPISTIKGKDLPRRE